MISWTDVACSVVPCDSACDADDTCDEAATSAFAAERTLVSTRVTSPTNSPNWRDIRRSSSIDAELGDRRVELALREPGQRLRDLRDPLRQRTGEANGERSR